VWQTVISQVLVLHLAICYYRAVFTDPGSVPAEPEWKPSSPGSSTDPVGKPSASSSGAKNYETKQSGDRRFCKWCDHFKPDRAHHCRVCRNCVLRMDHHCPWICNCVGYRNYKFFFCLVLTSLKASVFMAATSYESVRWSAEEQAEASYRFGIVYCMTISIVMAFILLMFFLVHIYLMTHATSTIEFCEKRNKKEGIAVSYDLGFYGNLKAALGPNPLLWVFAVDSLDGDGLTFQVTRLPDKQKFMSSPMAKGPDDAASDISSVDTAERAEKGAPLIR